MSCPAQTAITDSELSQAYGNGTQPAILPSTPNGASDREGNGMLKAATVSQIIANLKSTGIIPTATPTNAEAFDKKRAALLASVQAEYCFYDARYKYALQRLLGSIQQAYVANNSTTQTSVQQYLTATQALNQRLNDLVQIINGVTDDMLSTTSNMGSEIQAYSKQMKEQQKKLAHQKEIISSSQAVTKLNKEMVKYTEEKARYSDNLLKLYSVLNIVVLGLLIYVYKSSP